MKPFASETRKFLDTREDKEAKKGEQTRRSFVKAVGVTISVLVILIVIGIVYFSDNNNNNNDISIDELAINSDGRWNSCDNYYDLSTSCSCTWTTWYEDDCTDDCIDIAEDNDYNCEACGCDDTGSNCCVEGTVNGDSCSCQMYQATEYPTPPTAPPTPTPSPSGLCISSESIVTKLIIDDNNDDNDDNNNNCDKSDDRKNAVINVFASEINVYDQILGKNGFERVIAIINKNNIDYININDQGMLRSICYDDNDNYQCVRLADKHMLYVRKSQENVYKLSSDNDSNFIAMPSRKVEIGDEIKQIAYNSERNEYETIIVKVSFIDQVLVSNYLTILTESGTMVANNILISCYTGSNWIETYIQHFFFKTGYYFFELYDPTFKYNTQKVEDLILFIFYDILKPIKRLMEGNLNVGSFIANIANLVSA